MPQKLNTCNTVPNKGFRYFVPETGILIEAPDWETLLSRVRKNLTANGRTVPIDLPANVEDWLCNQLPAGFCYQMSVNDPKNLGGLSFEQVKQGTATLVDWFLGGKQRVEKSEAEARTKICASCQHNKEPQGCSGCAKSAIHDLVAKIVGGEKVAGGHLLKGCAVCGCSLEAKVWIPLETLQKNTTPERNALFPEWCWAKKK